MTDTFTWKTQAQPSGTENDSVYSSQYGDGYKQVAENGINPIAESWNLTYAGRLDEVAAVRVFLRAHIATSFWWKNPWGETLLYRVKSDSTAPAFQARDVVSLAFTFEQAFAP